ncbi:MAG TPA: helix-turn-helix domain-containing protein [Arachidicoccus sp.]|nr:helix-turn-helix domain-containing protein [Arachidicoccus sp.]
MHFDELIKIVKERRKILLVTQESLAELSGIGLRTLKQFESGKGNLTLHSLGKLVDALGLEICLKVKNLSVITNEKGKNII